VRMARLLRRDSVVRAGVLLLAAIPAGVLAARLVWADIERRAGEPQVVVPGRLFRSRQPQAPIAERLRRHGIGIVVDLRTSTEDPGVLVQERAACAAAGAEFVHMPLRGSEYRDQQVEEFLRIVRSARRPVLVHCEHGRSRTGLMIAGYRMVVQGWPKSAARREMIEQGWAPDNSDRRAHEEFLEHVANDRLHLLAASEPGWNSQPISRLAGPYRGVGDAPSRSAPRSR